MVKNIVLVYFTQLECARGKNSKDKMCNCKEKCVVRGKCLLTNGTYKTTVKATRDTK